MQYWQLASGDDTREYSSVFFDFGVAAVGPGRYGVISKETKQLYEDIGEYEKIFPITQIKLRDRIVLKSGQRKILAVGEVIKHEGKIYNHSNCFEDVDGWDLQHFVKVNWKKIDKTYDSNKLTRKTLEKLWHEEVIADIEKEWNTASVIDSYSEIKIPGQELSYEEIERSLIDHGLRIQDAENTSLTIKRVEKLADWYFQNQEEVWSTEHEVRTFLVVPLLQALGWSSQKIGIEVQYKCGKIDLMLYHDTKRQKPFILIETKRLFDGSALSVQQAKSYLRSDPELDSVQYFVATDGLKYWLYSKSDAGWQPQAYMNFRKKRNKYSAYPSCEGMMDFITHLIAN